MDTINAIVINGNWTHKLIEEIRNAKINIANLIADEISPTIVKDKETSNLLLDDNYYGKENYYVVNGLVYNDDNLYLSNIDKENNEVELLGNKHVPGLYYIKTRDWEPHPIFLDGIKVAKALELPCTMIPYKVS